MTDLGTFREKKFSRIGPKIREISRIRENFFSRKFFSLYTYKISQLMYIGDIL